MTPEIHDHQTANGRLKKRVIIMNNFLGGMAWGFGTVVGATIVVALLVGVISYVNFIPIIGDFVSAVSNEVMKNQASPFRR